VGVAASTLGKVEGDVAPTPAVAPFFWRVLAYLLDWLLGSIALLAVMKWLVLPNYGEALAALEDWFSQFWRDYVQMLRHPSGGLSASMEQANALGRRAAEGIPEIANEMLAQLGWMQTFFFWAYFFVCEYFTQGRSLGKKIFHLRVASGTQLGAPGFFDSLLRCAWKSFFFCSANPVMLLIGVIDAHIPLFNRTRRSWHDMFSRTIVVDENTSPLPEKEDKDGNDERGADDDGN
jgi:uncharacterized RDD family membrane protein YckC